MTHHEKQIIHLRSYLKGAQMFKAVSALETVIKTYGSDLRKDGKTLSVMHPIQIALSALLIPIANTYKEQLIILCLMHDMVEDYGYSVDAFVLLFGQKKGRKLYYLTELLSKDVNGNKKETEAYFNEMESEFLVVIAKGLDRYHNLNSMIACYSAEKMQEQVQETEKYILPTLKKAERNHPEHEVALFAVRFNIKQTLVFIKHIINVMKDNTQ